MKSTKKQLLMSTISLLLCFSMLLGTTYAWFTDEVTSGKNTIRAGNLDVELYHGKTLPIEKSKANSVDGATNLFGVALWEPGVVAYENFTVANVGTLTLKYKLKLRAWDFNKTADGKDLTNVIKVATVPGGIKPEGNATEVTREQAKALTYSGTFEDYSEEGVLLPGDEGTSTFGIVLYWEESDKDNDYNMNNGKTTSDGKPLYLDIGIDLVATQKDQNDDGVSEVDSFDETYDRLAEFPSIAPRITAFGSANKNRSSDSNNGVATEGVKVEIVKVETNGGGKIGEVEVSTDNVNKVMNDAFGTIGAPDEGVSKIEDKLVLNVKIETKDATTDSIKLDVSMFANVTRTTTKNDGEQTVDKKENQPVTELPDPVTIPLQLEPQLEDVTVTHSHAGDEPESMTMAESIEEITDGQFYYDENTGELFVKTSKFSDFAITYTRVAVASVNGTTYTTLQEAIENADDGQTVEILKDTDKNADTQSKDLTLTMNDDLAVSNVKIAEGSVVTLNGTGTFYATVEGELNIVGGKYDDVEFTGNGKISLTNTEIEKLVTLEGSSVEIDVIGSKVVKGELNGKPTIVIEDGKFETINIAHPEEVNLDVSGGTFHLEDDGEKEALEAQLGTDMYVYETGEEGWYGISPCSYEPLDAKYHNLRYKVNGVTKLEQHQHEFDGNHVCKKCGFTTSVGKVQIHTLNADDYVCITDEGMTDKDGKTVNTILDGKIEYDSNAKILKLMDDVSVGQIDFTCNSSGQGGIVLDLNGHILTANSWTALDIYSKQVTEQDPYGCEGYTLVINDSSPDTVHNGKIYYAEREHYYTKIYNWKYEGYEWFKEGSEPNGEFIADYTIKGGIITNVSAGKYGAAGDPYDGGGLSTCGNTTVTFNAGTFAGINADGDVGAIAMGKTQSSENCKLYMNEGASIVGCSGGTAGVRMYGSGYFELNGGKFDYCSGWETAHAVYTEESSVFVMNSGIIDHCYSDDNRPSIINLMGSGQSKLLGGKIMNSHGYAVIWNSDSKLVLDGVTIENCTASEGDYGGFMIMEATFEGNPTLTIKGSTKFINNTTETTPIADNVDSRVMILGGDFTQINNNAEQDLLTSIDNSFEGIKGGSFNNIHKEFVEKNLADGYTTENIDASTFKVVKK